MKHKKAVTMLLRLLGGIFGTLAVLVAVVLTALLYYETHDFRDWKGIDKTEFSCVRDDLTIRGTVFAPSGQADLPIAIVCHEFMTNRLFSYPYAMALAKSGYAAFCFDFCGGGIACGSDGDSRDMSVLTEMEDLRAVIAFAGAQRYTGDAPLLLVGCSQGGLVAALTAAELQAEVGGLILQYPALSIPDAARKGEMLWMHFDPDNVPEEMHSGPMRLGRRYATDVMDIDTLPAITRYTGKVLILHGDRDSLVDIAGSRRAAKAYEAAGADVQLHVIPDGTHIFLNPKQIRMAADLMAEFAARIKGTGSQVTLSNNAEKEGQNNESKSEENHMCYHRIGGHLVAAALFADNIMNAVISNTMGKDLPQLEGEPEVGKWYAIDIDNAASSDGSKWQGYFRKGRENKVVLYFYGGGFSVNDYTAARSMDVEGGFYNPRLNTGLNVMTYAIKEWGIGNSAEDNMFKDWTFIGVPYCNGDFHAGTGDKEYTALDGSTKTIYYNGYTNYRRLMTEIFNYIDSSPDQLLITGSSAGGFGAAILADDAIELFNNPQDVTVHVDSSLLINDHWHDIMVDEWNTPKAFSDVVTSDNITLDSLVALHNKRGNVKILLVDCKIKLDT